MSIIILGAILFSNIDLIPINAKITDSKKLGSSGSIISSTPQSMMVGYIPSNSGSGGSSYPPSTSGSTPEPAPTPEPEPIPEPEPEPIPEPESGVFFQDSFETGDVSNWSGSDSTAGETLDTINYLALQGTYSQQFSTNTDEGTEYTYVDENINTNELYARGYVYIDDGLPLSDEGDRFYIMRLAGSSQNLAYAGVRRNNGQNVWTVYTRDGETWSGWTDASTGPIQNTWQSIELYWKNDNTNGIIELYIDGIPVISVTGVDTSFHGSAQNIHFGIPYARDLNTNLEIYGDSVKLSTNYIGLESTTNPPPEPEPEPIPEPEPEPTGDTPDIIVALDGTGDYSNIQDAINAVPDNPTRVYHIYIKNGVYNINSLSIKSHIWLQGQSRDGVILRKQGTISQEMIRNNGATDQVTMQSMTVDMGQPAQLGDPLQPGIIKFRSGPHTDTSFIDIHVLNGEGEAITVANYDNLLVEDCLLENVQTGVNAQVGNNLIVRRTTIRNTIGNGIYPQALSSATQGCYGVLIEDCFLESAGDCAIDITCNNGLFEHRDVIIRDTEVRGGHIRISNAINVELNNVTMDGRRPVSIDTGRTHPITGESKPTIDVRIIDSNLKSSDDTIRISGATDITVLRTRVETTSSDKSAIVCNARGDNLFQDLTVIGGRYGFSYSWQLYGSTHVVVDDCTVREFGTAGFYDGNMVNNDFRILDCSVTGATGALYGVWTQHPNNNWSVVNTNFNSVQQNQY